MKRFKYILPALMTVWFLIAGSSCKKLLELESKNVPSSGKFWKTDKDALAGLLGGYSLLRDALTDENRYYVYGDVPANTYTITYNSDYSIHQLRDGSFDGSYYGYLENLQDWSKFYKAIAQTNLLIEKIPGIEEDAFKNPDFKNYYLGESYFLRAYNYFFISRVWGDVPLVLEAVEDVSEAKNYGREKQDIVLKQALADLDKAVTMLPNAPQSANDRGLRATKASALALQAHIYAWMKNYPKCEEVTRDLVANPGTYGLTFIQDSATYAKMTLGKSTESIFEINISYEQNEGTRDGVGQKTLWAPFLATREPNNSDGVPWTVNESTKDNLFWEAGDLRQKIWMYDDTRLNITMLKKYSNVQYKDGDLKRDPRFSNNIMIFRLSDIMLLRAEALYKTGKEGDARTLMNVTRNRAGIGDVDPSLVGVDFFYELIWERGRELYGEGHFYWDLIRTDIAIEYFNSIFRDATHAGSASFGRNYWPIPRKLFKDNLLMKQTPYWNGRL